MKANLFSLSLTKRAGRRPPGAVKTWGTGGGGEDTTVVREGPPGMFADFWVEIARHARKDIDLGAGWDHAGAVFSMIRANSVFGGRPKKNQSGERFWGDNGKRGPAKGDRAGTGKKNPSRQRFYLRGRRCVPGPGHARGR